ncbi:hypothetical protein ACOMHN_046577 [Nucella lapillus]
MFHVDSELLKQEESSDSESETSCLENATRSGEEVTEEEATTPVCRHVGDIVLSYEEPAEDLETYFIEVEEKDSESVTQELQQDAKSKPFVLAAVSVDRTHDTAEPTARSSPQQFSDLKLSCDTYGDEMSSDAESPLHIGSSSAQGEPGLVQQEVCQESTDETGDSASSANKRHTSTMESWITLQINTTEESPSETESFEYVQPLCLMAAHLAGKEVYESSENEGDLCKEKLFPSIEDPSEKYLEDDDTPAKFSSLEKKVTFQTNKLSTPHASDHSSDEHKMSTSSSEISVEPTLLAASYDLDSGQVSHVVSVLDLSPDSVEKKQTPTAPAKSILSSPEDDVFETSPIFMFYPENVDTPTEDSTADVTVTRQLSPDRSLPAFCSAWNGHKAETDTASHIVDASPESQPTVMTLEECSDQDDTQSLDESTGGEGDELSSSFEMLSPSELDGTSSASVFIRYEMDRKGDVLERAEGAGDYQVKKASEDFIEKKYQGSDSFTKTESDLNSETQLHMESACEDEFVEQEDKALDFMETSKKEVDSSKDCTPESVHECKEEKNDSETECAEEAKGEADEEHEIRMEEQEGLPETGGMYGQTRMHTKQSSGDDSGVFAQPLSFSQDPICQVDSEGTGDTGFRFSLKGEQYCQNTSDEYEGEKISQAVDRFDGGLNSEEPSTDIQGQSASMLKDTSQMEDSGIPLKAKSEFMETDPVSVSPFPSDISLPLQGPFSAPSSKPEDSAESENEPIEAELEMHDSVEFFSPDDHGDSSSADSFATVMAAAEYDDDDDIKDKIADIASMSSSIHSDIFLTQSDIDERFDEQEDSEAKMSIQGSPSRASILKDIDSPSSDGCSSKGYELSSSTESDSCMGKEYDVSSLESERYGTCNELLVDNDCYEYLDRAALSVITELSEEEQFEMTDTGTDTGPESDPQDHFHCSPPDGSSYSPAFANAKYFTRPLNDNASASSSLQEFEKLEKQLGSPGSSSIDTSDKESVGGSYDERKQLHFTVSSCEDKKFEYGSLDEKKLLHYKREMERDDASTTSSLAEFEKLEHQIDQQSSNSSVEDKSAQEGKNNRRKSGSGSGSDSVAGSASSLAEFEKLEAEMATESDDRCFSLDFSLQQKSATSSLGSLNDFEKLERDAPASTEIEAEAQKIVSYLQAGDLESGGLMYFKTPISCSTSSSNEGKPGEQEDDKHSVEIYSMTDQASVGGKDNKEMDSDSLEGDTSEKTEMTSSVIFAGADPSAPQTGTSLDVDTDSLAGEGIMQISNDSLSLSQQMRSSDSSKVDTDLSKEQEDSMVRSLDSLEQDKQSDKFDPDSLQEDVMQTSADSLDIAQVEEQMPESFMMMSVESAHWSMGSSGGMMYRSDDSHTDSQDFMQVSAESMEDLKSSRTEQILKNEQKHTEVIPEETDVQLWFCTSASTAAKVAKPHPTNPFLDDEGNVIEPGGYSQDDDDDEIKKESPFSYWGPRREEKRVLTKAEWEASGKASKWQAKQREREERASSKAPVPAEDEPGGTLNIVMTLL